MAGLDAIDGNEIDGEDTADAGALSTYNSADVKKAIETRDKLASDYTKYYDDIATRLKERQAGPSFSERMYQLSAALFAPTSTRGFSGVMGNVMPVLQAQQKARREGELTRQEALEDLQGKALTQQVGLANQNLRTQVDLARLDAMARKGLQAKYMLGQDGKWRIQPGTGNSPPMNAKGQYIVATQEEANMVPTGAEFVFANDKSNKVYWGK